MRRAAAAALCSLLPALPGCGPLLQTKTPPPTPYLLSAAPAASPAADAGPALDLDLAILTPHVRAGLDTDRIAALYPDRRLDYFADARWTGPLDKVIGDLAVQVFRARGGLRNVSGDASAFASAYWLEIEVTDFEAEYAAAQPAPSAHVHLQARIGRSDERRIIARFDADARQPAAENRLGAIVEAYDAAADTALTELAADCLRTLQLQSPAR